MKSDRRGSWYLLTGIVLGIAAGLFFSWMVSPVKYVNAPPWALRADYKDDYRALVAAAYLYSGDLVRAESRLAQLKEDGSAQSVAQQAQRAQAQGQPTQEVKALEVLAMALGEEVLPLPTATPSLPASAGAPNLTMISLTSMAAQPTENNTSTIQPEVTEASAVPTSQPASLFQPTHTVASTPTPGAPFELNETRLVCNPDQLEPLIQVVIQDAAGQPVPGIQLVVTWDGGESHFFTGLKPELGLGYADFKMTPQVVYSLSLAGSDQPVNDLIAAECAAGDDNHYWGSWMLTFVQP